MYSTPVQMQETGAYEDIGQTNSNPSNYQNTQDNNNLHENANITHPPVADAVDEANTEEYADVPENKPYEALKRCWVWKHKGLGGN